MTKTIHLVDTSYKVQKALDYLSKLTIMGVDTETTGLKAIDSKILLLQLGDTRQSFVFDIARLDSYSLGPIRELLNRPDIEKVMHNAKFDYSMIKTNFGVSMPRTICTYMSAALLTKGILNADNSLQGCLKKYLGVDIDKKEQKSFIGMKFGDKFTPEQIEYAGNDIFYLIPLWEKMKGYLESRGMEELSILENETIRVCGDMEINGMFLDQKQWRALAEKAKEKADIAKKELDAHFMPICQLDIFGEPCVNYDSPVQLKPLLEQLTGETLESTNEKDLVKINHPVIKSLLSYREARKKVTTYGDSFIKEHVHPVTKCIHSNFKQLGTDSGRMASSDPNMQNIPSDEAYRACFTARAPGYKIISADFSGQELRLLAQISKEPAFIHALKNKMDLHSYSASLIFDVPYDDFFEYDAGGKVLLDDNGDPVIKKEMKKKYRTPAKSITFGLIYGMGPGKLADTINVSLSEAKEFIQKYFIAFPKIKETLDYFTNLAMENQYAWSPLDGRRRLFSGIDWDDKGIVSHLKNVAKNQPFQGAGASVTKLALCWIKREIDSNGWDAKIISVIHDEIVVEVKEEIAVEVAKMTREKMIAAFNHYAPDVPMEVAPTIGEHWAK